MSGRHSHSFPLMESHWIRAFNEFNVYLLLSYLRRPAALGGKPVVQDPMVKADC